VLTKNFHLERQVGISSYVSSHEGFAAVVKARYSDFIVLDCIGADREKDNLVLLDMLA